MIAVTMIALLLMFLLGLYGLALGAGAANFPHVLSGRRSVTAFSFLILVMVADTSGIWAYFHTPLPQAAVQKSVTYSTAWITALAMRSRLTLPVKVNQDVQLENIQSDSGRLVYVMSIKAPDSESFLQSVDQVRSETIKNGCQREDYRTLMKYGLGIEIDFIVSGAWGAEPIILTPEMCGFQ